MTTVNAYNRLTLLELAKRRDPDGSMSVIAEVLHDDNPIIQDAPFVEANQATSHKMTRRLSLPTGTWRRINQGVAASASQTIQVIEPLAMLEAYSTPDKALVDMSPDPKAFRMSEATAFIEGMSQTLASTLFYGNSAANPEQFDGLAPRMASLDPDGLVVSANGSGSDVTSIYIVQWGPNRVFLAYPKGHPAAGVEHRDLGEDTVHDADGNPFQAYRDHFRVYCGLAVKDSRCIARVANIETAGTSNIFDEDRLITVLNRMPNSGAGAIIYVNGTIKTQMEIALKDKANVNFTTDNGLGGVAMLRFRGIPVKKCDAILNTETAIS
jgi:hypothetical protein